MQFLADHREKGFASNPVVVIPLQLLLGGPNNACQQSLLKRKSFPSPGGGAIGLLSDVIHISSIRNRKIVCAESSPYALVVEFMTSF